MAENPLDTKNFGLLAALGAEPRPVSLLDYIASPTPKPDVGLLAQVFANVLIDKQVPALPVSPLSGAALDLFSPSASHEYSFGSLGASAELFAPARPIPNPNTNCLSGGAADLFPSPSPFGFTPNPRTPEARTFGSLAGYFAPSTDNALYSPPKPRPVSPETKRKVFFSFNFDDIMRVNNVRNAWKITHPDSSSNRSFYDSSLWETKKVTDPVRIKQLIRLGVLGTSTVCILAGSTTWSRRWVRYEIARALIDGRGLLTVHLNSLNHHQTKGPDPRGRNPLVHMGIAKIRSHNRMLPEYFIYEKNFVADGHGGVVEQWSRYSGYSDALSKPAWLSDPGVNEVMPLSVDTSEYDYAEGHGHRNIGSWIDLAAKQAGR